MSQVDRRGRQVSLGSALLRRGWLVIACAVAVAALAYGISHIQSATYSAEAVLNVPASLGPTQPGSAQEAASLAGAYSSALPRDDVLAAHAARAAGAHGAIRASKSGSLLTIGYMASSRTAALKGARSIVHGLTEQHPITSTVSPGTLQPVQRPQAHRVGLLGGWRADARLIVSSGAGPAGVSADNSNKIAATYADILSNDQKLIAVAAAAVHRPAATVRNNISVTNDQDTSVVRIRYKDSSAARAATGARAIAAAVTGSKPATPTIEANSLQTVSLPKLGTSSSAVADKRAAIPIGAGLGLVLGLVLLIAWERSDPHVTRASDLSRQMGYPATPVDRLSEDAARALLERWAALSGREHGPVRVALLPANRSVEGATGEIADYLVQAGGGRVGYEDRGAAYVYADQGNGNGSGRSPHGADTDIVLVQAPPPGGAGGGEGVALECDLTVAVIPRAMKAANLRALSEDLADFGVVPAWALLTSGRRAFGTRPPVPQSAPVG